MYNITYHRLPDSLDDLRPIPGFEDAGGFICPISKKPYIYNREGIPSPSGAGKIILYDATPVHNKMRLCIEIVPPTEAGKALVTKVISLPESFFKGK